MTLTQFNALSRQTQQETVLRSGIFLSERKQGAFRVMLYQLEGFYIEVYFYKQSNVVFWLKSFSSTEELQPYLQQIDLTQLLQDILVKY